MGLKLRNQWRSQIFCQKGGGVRKLKNILWGAYIKILLKIIQAQNQVVLRGQNLLLDEHFSSISLKF